MNATLPTKSANHQARILVVDDEEDAVYSFRRVFEKSDYEILEAHSGEEALAICREEHPDVVLMDVRMPGAGGLETLKELHRLDPRVPVILMTAYASTQGTIEAMKAGAFDHVLKPFDVEKIRAVVRSAVKVSRDMRHPVAFGGSAAAATPQDDQVIGRSDAMQEVYKAVGRVAVSDLPVLLSGEPGTGKELIARVIYQNSGRASQPFLSVHCDKITPELLDAELFGQRRGAILGASGDRLGKLEMCSGGTVFLEGIEVLPLAVQAKLLRFLETGEIERVGDPRPTRVDVRLIAATHTNLELRVSAGTFRADLWNRLRVAEVTLPPLRERTGDLPLLVDHFLARHAPALGLNDVRLDRAAMAALAAHPFPGNVRELEQILRTALLRAKGSVITVQDLELAVSAVEERGDGVSPLADDTVFDMLFDEIARRQPLPPGFDAFDVVERKLIIRALEACSGNQSKASRFLGITRNTLRKRIQKYGLVPRGRGETDAAEEPDDDASAADE